VGLALALVFSCLNPSGIAVADGLEAGVQQKTGFEENQVRAAFLHAFAKYTEWPEATLPARETLIIGVMGDGPFAQALEGLPLGNVKGRKVAVKRFRSASDVQPCHILYFPSEEEALLAGMRKRLAAWNVLTVGETSRFLGLGGAIQLFHEEGRLRFVVNRATLEKSSLQVEAKALKLAKTVIYQP
jgi:hypothetical protein